MQQPLEGVRVIDISRLEIGAMATQVLADLGADVIKVEPLGLGEEVRRYLPLLGGESAFVVASYRNRRSIQADLKTEGGRQVVYDLVKDGDVFVEVSRDGVMPRIGMDEPTLRELNPRLVYCSIRAFGSAGPYSMQNSHSPDIDFYAGVATIEDDDRDGLRTRDLMNISAHAGASSAATAMIAALFGARTKGEGTHVEVSMWDAAVMWDAIRATMVLNDTWFPGGPEVGSRATPKHCPYKTSDGNAIFISTVEPRYWQNFCQAIGRPDLGQFTISEEAATDWGSTFPGLYDMVATTISERTAGEWEKVLAASDVPFAVVQTRLEALEGAQAQARDVVWTLETRTGERCRTVGRSFLLDGDRGSVRFPLSAPGEHTEEVLAEIGYGRDQIARLRSAGAIG